MVVIFAYMLVSVFLVTFLITKVWRRLRARHYELPAGNATVVHRWCVVDAFDRPTFCAVSGRSIVEGAYCEVCGVRIGDVNASAADRTLPCKEPSASATNGHRHLWVRGNLPLGSCCISCRNPCGSSKELCDVRCSWCGAVAHDDCHDMMASCDLGPYRNSIVPPNCVRLRCIGRVRSRRRVVVSSVSEPKDRPIDTWRPLVVMANRKSGSGYAECLLRDLRGILNPIQVIDLSEIPPEGALEWCLLLPHVTWRVMVAGGDGTVGWVLSAIDKLKLKVKPEVFIVPLGTGNDLAQVLGLGEGYSGEVHTRELLDIMNSSVVMQLDRWQLEVVPVKHFGIRMPTRTYIVNNYASVGVDALVTLNFHRHRQSQPMLFGSRIINKFWYFTYGTKDVLERECKDLHTKLKLELDGKLVELPPIEGIVVLNIASWGGGCRPWEINGSSSQIAMARPDDGLLEVIALYSSFHIAQMQVGLAEPLRLGQARVVKMVLTSNAPMQVDGEPWEQHPASLTITHYNQASMLASLGTP